MSSTEIVHYLDENKMLRTVTVVNKTRKIWMMKDDGEIYTLIIFSYHIGGKLVIIGETKELGNFKEDVARCVSLNNNIVKRIRNEKINNR